MDEKNQNIQENKIYSIEKSMFSKVNEFIFDSLRSLEYDCNIRSHEIRISMPNRFIKVMQYYSREMYHTGRQNEFPTKFNNVTVLENYKNEIAVFCVNFEHNENELIKTLSL